MSNPHDEIVALQAAVATLTTEVDSLTSQVSAQASEIAALQAEITQTPRIVASGSISKPAGYPIDIAPTVIYTPETPGVFRCSVDLTGPMSGFDLNVSWTDENGPQQTVVFGNGNVPRTLDVLFHATANPIRVSTTNGNLNAAVVLYYELEQLT